MKEAYSISQKIEYRRDLGRRNRFAQYTQIVFVIGTGSVVVEKGWVNPQIADFSPAASLVREGRP